MPSPAAVQDQLTRIIVHVVGCEPGAVVQAARLEDLGVDSLSIVEVAEKLGQVFEIYIPDEVINSMVTVDDAIDAVIHHDPKVTGPAKPAPATPIMRPSATTRQSRPLSAAELERRKHIAWRFGWGFVIVGLVLGGVFGLGGTALINASGLKDVQHPVTSKPSKSATTPSPTPTHSPTTTQATEEPKPSLSAEKKDISPGERLRLTGQFPGLSGGATLQVQVKDPGSGWDDFPVTARTSGDGKFSTVIFTTRTGERKFRMMDKASNTATPEITITIGR